MVGVGARGLLLGGSDGKESTCNSGDLGLIPGLGRSPGEGNQCMKVKSQSEVAHSCPTPSDPMDCSLPGSSVHEIFQARIMESFPACTYLPHHCGSQPFPFSILQPPGKDHP